MSDNLYDIFLNTKHEPESDLVEKTWRKVVLREKRVLRLKLYLFSFIGLVSLTGFIPAFKMLLNDFTQSGFYEYLSLAFSSNGLIFSYWKEFSYSLLQSLPATSIVLSLILVLIFFLSLRYIIKQIINNNRIGRAYGMA